MWKGVLIIVHIHLVGLSPISFPYTYYVVLKPWSHSRLSCHFFSFGVFFQISFDNLRFQVASFNILISFSMFLCKFYYCTLFCVCVCFHFLLWAWILVFLQMSYISFGYNAPFKFNILSFVLRESTMIIVDINMIIMHDKPHMVGDVTNYNISWTNWNYNIFCTNWHPFVETGTRTKPWD